jgi:hypothetical protein
MGWVDRQFKREQEIKGAAKKAADELLDRFAPYPAELKGKPVSSMAEAERLKHRLWQIQRDDVRRILARALG